MDLKELEKMIDLCRKKGVRSLKTESLSIELDPEALFPESPYKQKLKQKEIEAIKDPAGDPITDSVNALFWSTPDIGVDVQ